MLRKAGERTVSSLWNPISKLVNIFQADESANYSGHADMNRNDRQPL